MNTPDPERLDEIFARGTVVEAYPSTLELKKKLLSGGKIRIYYGLDPTFTAIHLGHAKNIIFLEELRQLGHEVILLFGDFTARIGDPDKSATRTQLSAEDVQRNVSDWKRQIAPLISFDDKTNPATIKFNSEWLAKLSFEDVIKLASNFTVQQFIERDLFERRLKAGNAIHLHEFMYPLMQGYDSVAMDVDAELCGTDQTFNALAGRTLLKRLKNKDKFIIALNLLANPKTGELMSKSNGTGVFINAPANELFGAIMALPDAMIEPLYLNCTRLPLAERSRLMERGPREAKARVASDIVKRFHGEAAAISAEESFEKTFAKGGVPDDVREIIMPKNAGAAGPQALIEALIKADIVPSKAEWRRLIDGGAVRDEDDEKITDPNFQPAKTMILKIGKRRFVKVVAD
ncbi:MAG: tyrosine--tRNA ligase [Patescibacteria group bacterium]|nr:tyrosine--tRNA ligase [Patescibacteria group bacterium]MDE2172657.1 tyrosine--tRNA ligase [Patescibacteria group bacterium]